MHLPCFLLTDFMSRVRVKICGITNERDAFAAIDAGADALGFNLWPGSKRYINLEEHAFWIAQLPPFVVRVALLVNASLEESLRVAAHPAINVVQFHGDESAEFLTKFVEGGRSCIAALRLSNASQAEAARRLPVPNLLLDAAVPGSYGGTGRCIDLALARAFVEANPDRKVTLAGGLEPNTVRAAIVRVRPYAVDVASGVEISPGRKDVVKMRLFAEAVREAEAEIRRS